MERFEMVEHLSQKAGVSLEEARRALEENQWDMLDAMIALERAGKTAARAARTETENENAAGEAGGSEPQKPRRVRNIAEDDQAGFKAGCRQIWHYIRRAFQITLDNDFVILRRDKRVLAMPVLVLIVLLIACFWVTLPLLIIGLFFGFRYRFEGKQAGPGINRAMEKLDSVADQIKETLGADDGQE